MDAGSLLRRTRETAGIDQSTLARRAGTSQAYISRIERGDVSPSVNTLTRLFHAMGYKLRAEAEPLPHGNASLADLRADAQLTPGERLDQAMELSEFLTSVAASGGEADVPRPLRPRQLLATLARHGVQFVVIGGMSLAVHNYVRATKDLDIVPDPDPPNLDRLAAALRELEASVDCGDIGQNELGIRPDPDGLRLGGNGVLMTKFGRLDVMQEVGGMPSYRQLREGAMAVEGVWYAGYDELIRMKVAAGREQDLIDIGALEAARRASTGDRMSGVEPA